MQVNLVNQSIISAYVWEWSKFWLFHTRKHSSFEITSFAPSSVKTFKKSTSFYDFASHSKESVTSDYSERKKKKNRKQLTLIHTPAVVQRRGGGGWNPSPEFLISFLFYLQCKASFDLLNKMRYILWVYILWREARTQRSTMGKKIW